MEIRSEGLRVYLKTLGVEDAEGIASNANDYEITRNVARLGEFPFPYTFDDALSFIAYALEKEDARQEQHFGIRLGGETIGACALMGMDTHRESAELGYWIGRRYWGMGYAKEALALLVDYAFGQLGIERLWARTFGSNERSVRLLESLHFSRTESAGHDDELGYDRYKKDGGDRIGLEVSGA